MDTARLLLVILGVVELLLLAGVLWLLLDLAVRSWKRAVRLQTRVLPLRPDPGIAVGKVRVRLSRSLSLTSLPFSRYDDRRLDWIAQMVANRDLTCLESSPRRARYIKKRKKRRERGKYATTGHSRESQNFISICFLSLALSLIDREERQVARAECKNRRRVLTGRRRAAKFSALNGR